MRRHILSFIGVVLLAGAIIGPLVHASATADGTLGQPSSGAAAGAMATQTTTAPPRQTTPVVPVTGNTPTSTAPQAGYSYVAMGDSVAAGAGLPALANATTRDELCDRSSQAYPYIIAERLQTTVVHTACSGAKTDEGIYGDQIRNGTRVPAQMTAAFAEGTPEIMTVTIGANDVRWTQFVRQCYVTRCGLAVDNARMKVYRADLRIELTRMLTQINTDSQGNPPQVYISGYYSPLANTECIAENRITAPEAEWMDLQTANLNQAIRSVVPLFDFAQYVPVDFSGHEVCSAEPYVQGLEAEAPIHPTAAGQAAIAESFLSAMGR